MTPHVLGLDLSLRSCGLALVPVDWAPALDWGRVIVRTVGQKLDSDATPIDQALRCIDIADAIVRFVREQRSAGRPPEAVWIEEYAFSKGDARSHQIGELGGVVRAELVRNGIRFDVVVASSARAKLGRFSARAPAIGPKVKLKDQVHAALRSMGAPRDWTGDELDALAIANHGIIEGGHRGIFVPSPAAKRRAPPAKVADIDQEGLF